MRRLLEDQPVFGFKFKGTRFDCGDKAGFQMANLAYAMERPDIRKKLLAFIRDRESEWASNGPASNP